MLYPAVAAPKRIALVIGNGAYENLGRLKNTGKDAALITTSLKQANFEVTTVVDGDLRSMRRAFISFARAIQGDVEATFVFYAGHGLQVDGENYLMPIDANISREDEVPLEGINANDFLRVLNSSTGTVNIVVLDACRDNPFPTSIRSVANGLAPVLAPRGTFIAYSTAPGSVAYDGGQENSYFSDALAQFILEPGLEISQVFRRVRQSVITKTGERQTPWESSSIVGDFYFIPPQASPASNAASPYLEAAVRWGELQNSTDTDALRRFVAEFRGNPFASLAEARLSSLLPATATLGAPQPTLPSPERQTDLNLGQDIALAPASPGMEVNKVTDQNELKRMMEAAEGTATERGWQLFLRKFGSNQAASEIAIQALRRLMLDGKLGEAHKDTESALMLSPIMKIRIQSTLSSRGFQVGSADGVFGRRTRSAIAEYQRSVGVASTGYLNLPTIQQLGLSDGLDTNVYKSNRTAKTFRTDLLKSLGEDQRVVDLIECLGAHGSYIYGQYQWRIYAAVRGIQFGNIDELKTKLSRCKLTLVSIKSSEENSFVYDLFAQDDGFFQYDSNGLDHYKFGPLIGLLQPIGSTEPSGGWAWESGEAVTYSNWDRHEPNNRDYIERYARFSALQSGSVGIRDRRAERWSDISEMGPGFVVELQ